MSVGKHAVWEIYLYSIRQSFDSMASIMHDYTIVKHCCYVMYLSADLIIYKYRYVRDIFRYIYLASLRTHCITLGHGEGMIGGGPRFIFKRSYVSWTWSDWVYCDNSWEGEVCLYLLCLSDPSPLVRNVQNVTVLCTWIFLHLSKLMLVHRRYYYRNRCLAAKPMITHLKRKWSWCLLYCGTFHDLIVL